MSFTGKQKKRYGFVFLAVLLLSLLASITNFSFNAEASISGSFGRQDGGGTHGETSAANTIFGNVFTSPTGFLSAQLTNITWYEYGINSGNVKAVLIHASNKTIIAVSDAITVPEGSDTWRTNIFSTPPIIYPSTSYGLMLIADFPVGVRADYSGGSALIDSSNSYASPTDPTDATTAGTYYNIYASYVAYDATISSSPEINAEVIVNSVTYATPATLYTSSNCTFTAESSKVYGDNAYVFDHWLVNSTDSYSTASITLNITAPTTIEIHYTTLAGVFHFYGPYNETTGEQLNENVTVTAHYADGTGIADYSFVLNGTWVYPPDYSVQYFEFLFDDGSTRQYWIDPSEIITDLYVFKASDPTSYVINFLDYTGVLQTYPYVTIKASVNGTLFTVEKRRVDEQNSIGASLILGEKYQLVIGNDEYNFVYGDLLATATTGVQLILRGVDFPKETLLMFKNVVLYGLRDFSSSSISFYYADSLNATTSVNVVFTDSLGTVAYNQTFTADYVNLNWTSAVNATSYQLDVSVVHEEYGDFTWSQYFTNEAGEGPAIFDFSFLGTWTVDMTYLFPAILILFVAACFSALNAEVGAVLTVIVAALLTWIGWIPIPAGFLVAGLAIAILMALVYNKRRGAVY